MPNLPASINTVTCTFGKRYGVLGTQATIVGTVELDRELTWEATGDVLDAYQEPFASGAGGFATLQLPYTDQDGFTDGSGTAIKDFSLILKARVLYGGQERFTVEKPFQLTSDQVGPIDIDLIDTGAITLPVTAPAPRVSSVAGKTGAITSEDVLEVVTPGLETAFVRQFNVVIPASVGGPVLIPATGLSRGVITVYFVLAMTTGEDFGMVRWRRVFISDGSGPFVTSDDLSEALIKVTGSDLFFGSIDGGGNIGVTSDGLEIFVPPQPDDDYPGTPDRVIVFGTIDATRDPF